MDGNKATIQKQVKLPIGVALQVVGQGIRIRLGRSVVTLLGVVFGIAFLMSLLTGQAIRTGVGRETQLRDELDRRINFLTAKTGPLKDATLGVIQAGPLDETERRFVKLLAQNGLKSFNWVGNSAPEVEQITGGRIKAVETDYARVAGGAPALLVIGDGALPEADWDAMAGRTRERAIATMRDYKPVTVSATVVPLARELQPDELARITAEKRKDKVRTIWIVTLALLVTVIGISNAMLMSVTERFREIGTMKCLGAVSGFIRQMFFIESTLLGFAGSLAGVVLGIAFSIAAFSITYGPAAIWSSLDWPRLVLYAVMSVFAGVLLSVVAAIYPAGFASRMVPATALRSTV